MTQNIFNSTLWTATDIHTGKPMNVTHVTKTKNGISLTVKPYRGNRDRFRAILNKH